MSIRFVVIAFPIMVILGLLWQKKTSDRSLPSQTEVRAEAIVKKGGWTSAKETSQRSPEETGERESPKSSGPTLDRKGKVAYLHQLIKAVDFNSAVHRNKVISQMLVWKQDIASEALLAAYDDVKEASPYQRTKLIWFASRMNNPKLRNLWVDLIDRTHTNDRVDFDGRRAADQHLGPMAKAIGTEQTMAINNLGALARTDVRSKRILRGILQGKGYSSIEKMAAKRQLHSISGRSL